MNARERALAASPRRRLRYIYLVDVWPEARGLNRLDAFLDAPDTAVISALAKEVEVYYDVIQQERGLRVEAEAKLKQLEDAVALVLGVAARGRLAGALA